MGFGCENIEGCELFLNGNFSDDLYPISNLAKAGYDRMLISQSFSKIFTIYGERLGALSVVAPDVQTKELVESWMKATALPEYSNPPIHGAKIVSTILQTDELRKQWLTELQDVSDSLRSLRKEFCDELKAKTGENWDFVQ